MGEVKHKEAQVAKLWHLFQLQISIFKHQQKCVHDRKITRAQNVAKFQNKKAPWCEGGILQTQLHYGQSVKLKHSHIEAVMSSRQSPLILLPSPVWENNSFISHFCDSSVMPYISDSSILALRYNFYH